MRNLTKAAGILVILAVLLIVLERWYNIFYDGQLFRSIGLGMALLGFASPVLATVVAGYVAYQIVRA